MFNLWLDSAVHCQWEHATVYKYAYRNLEKHKPPRTKAMPSHAKIKSTESVQSALPQSPPQFTRLPGPLQNHWLNRNIVAVIFTFRQIKSVIYLSLLISIYLQVFCFPPTIQPQSGYSTVFSHKFKEPSHKISLRGIQQRHSELWWWRWRCWWRDAADYQKPLRGGRKECKNTFHYISYSIILIYWA